MKRGDRPDTIAKAMPSQSSANTTSSGRPAQVVDYYRASYLDELGRDTAEGVGYRLEHVNATVREMKFDSIFDAALSLLESGTDVAKEQLIKFAREGKFGRFLELATGSRKGRKAAFKSDEIGSAICTTARTLYLEDWRNLTDSQHCHRLRMPLKSMKAEDILTFNLNTLYAEMRSHAPQLFALFEGMGNESNEGEDDDKKLRRQRRHITMATFILGNMRSRQINYLQAIMTYFLYSNRVPKRVINIMHPWGATVSYSSALDAVKNIGNAQSIYVGG